MSELIISCLSQKGGVGKSTLARMVAGAYAHAGWTVKICDFNTKQKTSVDWVAARLEQGVEPEIAAEPFNSTKSFRRETADLLVIDGKPDSDVTSLDAALVSNLVVLPTDVNLDDLRPQVLFANELVSKGVDQDKIIFVINKSSGSTRAPLEARSYLRKAGYKVAENELRRLAPYGEAQNYGRTIMETANEELNERAGQLALELVGVIKSLVKESAA